jgi:formylglycine-generating enzyme required for sulfatase activity
MKTNLVKGLLTIVGAVLLSTLGIYASDSLQGVGQMAGVKNASVCDDGMVLFVVDGRTMCVDIYEASPSEKCPHTMPSNIVQSEENTSIKECLAVSAGERMPWNFISLPQAQRMCAASGKRLPTSKEWYQIALGTDVQSCVVQSDRALMTGGRSCVSSLGVHDAIGNVWEWVNEEISGNRFNDRELPHEGYVTSVDIQGVALTTGESADVLYGEDYIWSKSEGVFGMLRGGFYGSGNDAGLYSINASVSTSFATQGVGFRCVKDLF